MFTSFAPRPSFLRPGFAISPPGVGAGGAPPVDSTIFLALTGDSGIVNASNALTINSLAGTLKTSLLGADATAIDWPQESGTGLVAVPIASAGTLPTLGLLTPATEAAERAIRLEAGQVFQAASQALLGTDDFVIEALICLSAADLSSAATIFATKSTTSSASGAGWALQTVTGGLRFTMRFGATSISRDVSVSANQWLHVLVACDRSDATGLVVHVNAVASAAQDFSTFAATDLDTAGDGAVTLGATTTFAAKLTSHIGFVRAWSRAGWFAGGATNSTQWAAAAKERFARLTGTFPAVATGTAVPSTMTRTSAAYLDRVIDDGTGERRLFLVAPNWIRYGRRGEAAGGEFLNGALLEAQATNLVLQSETFDNASWTKAGLTVTANAAVAPDGATTGDTLDVSVGLGAATVTQAVTLTAASYVLSAWVKAGARSRCWLGNATIANGIAWFDLAGGTVGTVQAGIAEALIEPFGNGWFRCSIRFTGTVAAHTLAIGVASTDGSTTTSAMAGALSVWGAQCELGEAPSSYIATVTATATRTLDTLQYKADDGNVEVAAGQLSADVLHPALDLQTDHMIALASASAASTTDSLSVAANTSDQARARVIVGGVAEADIAGTSDIADGEAHTVTTSWDTNAGKLLVDGVQEGATDVSVAVLGAAPALLTVGQLNSAQSANALIGNVRVRDAAA